MLAGMLLISGQKHIALTKHEPGHVEPGETLVKQLSMIKRRASAAIENT